MDYFNFSLWYNLSFTSIQSNKKKVGTSPIVPVVKSSWKSVEMKLMAIPVIFLLLRIWSICTGIIFIYSDAYCWVDPAAIKALYYLSVSEYHLFVYDCCATMLKYCITPSDHCIMPV